MGRDNPKYNRRDMSKAEYLDLQTVYDIYGVKPTTIQREIWEQKARNIKDKSRGIGVHCPHYKIGGKVCFKKSDIDEYLERIKVSAFCNSDSNIDAPK
jgi:predicted DNA-binding transcriptional regulator AlpA